MPENTILVADDDGTIRTVVSRALSRQGFRVQATGVASQLWRWIEEGQGDAAVIDVVLPDENTLELLPRIRQKRPELPIIVMSAQNTLLTAVRATERGAFEYLPKPFDLNNLVTAVQRAVATPTKRAQSPDVLLQGEDQLPIIGRSPAMQEIYRIIARLMGTDLTVMIIGESGTGKELVAQALHDFGKRRGGPFVAVNMAAIPRELIESELFGHERGAFTGANQRRAGRFEQAEGGTLFLDEIGDMPLEAQTRLLRVLQQGEFLPVGGRNPVKANLRIVAATHRNLRQMVAQGLFREDLFYRLNVVPIRLPALRERREDIPALVQHFLTKAHGEGLPLKMVEPEAMQLLRQHDWPGNVRELENLVRRLAVLYVEETIGAQTVNDELDEATNGALGDDSPALDDTLRGAVERHIERYFAAQDGEVLSAADLYARVIREVEKPLIAKALSVHRGNQLKAAHLLGLNRNTLRKKIRELDIEVVRGSR
ncbi:nitrogen regulation protein NR(I) [Marinivivus vitaminiproducens]|uniref:nitrogen regulation protein NR(I) n=1 Tax=Marinivivus vitaminiproducens TaxID=3035935 RepID=UPI0027A9D54D|nr:nitrogen regulation protein NR(I) [Geminicoccaceae bacterium SCSIO 64248]